MDLRHYFLANLIDITILANKWITQNDAWTKFAIGKSEYRELAYIFVELELRKIICILVLKICSNNAHTFSYKNTAEVMPHNS